jgi:hypothetical protein
MTVLHGVSKFSQNGGGKPRICRDVTVIILHILEYLRAPKVYNWHTPLISQLDENCGHFQALASFDSVLTV